MTIKVKNDKMFSVFPAAFRCRLYPAKICETDAADVGFLPAKKPRN